MTDTKPELLLYVWAEFSHADGLAFAVAETEEQAKEMVRVKLYDQCYLNKDPLYSFWHEAAESLDWGPVQVFRADEVFRADQSVAFAVEGGE